MWLHASRALRLVGLGVLLAPLLSWVGAPVPAFVPAAQAASSDVPVVLPAGQKAEDWTDALAARGLVAAKALPAGGPGVVVVDKRDYWEVVVRDRKGGTQTVNVAPAASSGEREDLVFYLVTLIGPAPAAEPAVAAVPVPVPVAVPAPVAVVPATPAPPTPAPPTPVAAKPAPGAPAPVPATPPATTSASPWGAPASTTPAPTATTPAAKPAPQTASTTPAPTATTPAAKPAPQTASTTPASTTPASPTPAPAAKPAPTGASTGSAQTAGPAPGGTGAWASGGLGLGIRPDSGVVGDFRADGGWHVTPAIRVGVGLAGRTNSALTAGDGRAMSDVDFVAEAAWVGSSRFAPVAGVYTGVSARTFTDGGSTVTDALLPILGGELGVQIPLGALPIHLEPSLRLQGDLREVQIVSELGTETLSPVEVRAGVLLGYRVR